MEYVTVSNAKVPALGLGTWRMGNNEGRNAVGDALDLGYRHIDTAQAYRNERAVGAAISGSTVPREDLFLTTKLDWSNRDYESVLGSTDESLEKLDTDYVDLLLVHQPNLRTPLEETIAAMDELHENGATRYIGVSNFSVDAFDRARKLADAPVITNQVQYHPFWSQRELLDYCQIHDLMLTAYSPLAHGGAVHDDLLSNIGARYDKTAAQVALRWLVQQENVTTIPKSTSREHIEANLAVFDFELTEGEMRAIARPSASRTATSFVRGRLSI